MYIEKLFSRFTKKPIQDGGSASNAAPRTSENEPTTKSFLNIKGQIGLIPLNTGITGPYFFDIVAVHGINGDAVKTWTHDNGINWLQDFLPAEFPGARIYSYGYPASIFWSRDEGSISDFSRSLLESLKYDRAQDQSRKIIFICHSMGGIVVKKALTMARIDEVDYGQIHSSVAAILFLGTPHRGSGIASLLKLPLEAVAFASVPLINVTGKTRKDLVKSLKKNAEPLKEVSTDFRNQIINIRIASFIEKAIMKPLDRTIVDENSGVMDIPGERIVPMHGCDHQTIVRFESKSSNGYKRVLGVLKDFADETKDNLDNLSPEEMSCLKSLAFPEMGYRRSDADRAHPKTCGWILEHESYKTWLNEKHGLLWIKGKPGAGKSTLLAFIYRIFQTRSLNQPGLNLEFFFHGRGTTLQKTSIGMFRSLLHQLFKQDTSARKLIVTTFHDKAAFGEAGRGWDWQLRELQDLFFAGILAAAKFRKIVVFIDALDEAGPDSKTLVEYLHRLNDHLIDSQSTAAICISCRHYPITARIPGLDVVVEENNSTDIACYVRDMLSQAKLRADTNRDENGSQATQWTMVEQKIVSNAESVFQWARLVVQMVIEQKDEGYSWDEVHRMLAEVPRELDDVYKHILNNIIKPERLNKTLHMIQCVLLAQRPLSVDELQYAMAFDDTYISRSMRSYKEAQLSIKRFEGMYKLVNSLSGGLAEVKNHYNGNIVQFIHQSVNDFLLSGGIQSLASKIAESPPNQDSQYITGASTNEILGRGHDRLCKACVNYLRLGLPEVNWKKVRVRAGSKQLRLPLIDYSANYWIIHAEKAEKYDISQQHLVLHLDSNEQLLEKWARIFKMVIKEVEYRQTDNTSLLHIVSSYDLRSVLEVLLEKGTNTEARDDLGNTALHYAALSGHENIIKMLLERGAEPSPKNNAGNTPMEYAAISGFHSIVKLLLNGPTDIDSALQAAAVGGSIPILNLLLECNADINSSRGEQRTPLQAAARAGNEDAVQFLLSKGADINGQSEKYASALDAAAASLNESLIQSLLNKGANIHLQGGILGNALQAAAFYRNKFMIKELLDRGADVNMRGGKFETALQAAAVTCEEDCSELLLLLQKGADVNIRGGEYGNPLQAACASRNFNAVKLLIEEGADVNAEGGYYGNPLQAAAKNGKVEMIRLLLERGAKINAQGGYHGTALQAAAQYSSTDAVALLLQKGADFRLRGGPYETSLQAAAVSNFIYFKGNPMNVELLLAHGAKVDINVQGGKWGNALRAAIHDGERETVMLLLKHGAIFDPQDEEFSKALLQAAPSEVDDMLWDKVSGKRRVNGHSWYT